MAFVPQYKREPSLGSQSEKVLMKKIFTVFDLLFVAEQTSLIEKWGKW